jgi:uncharacterized protein YyaL (SSP411 family)
MDTMDHFKPLRGMIIVLMACVGLCARGEEKNIVWRPWSDAVLAEAASNHKLVLMDLEAGWCHWCHVMDTVTYADPAVIDLIGRDYIAVRVDQDSRPDLANRYEDYGWPATVIFKWDGSELAKRQGYIPPKPMAAMLKAFADDPTPGPSVTAEEQVAPAAQGALTKDQEASMRASFLDAYDSRQGGWGHGQKLLDWNALEYCLTQGDAGDKAMTQMARQTMMAGLKLIDPVWGGVDQYSTDGDWVHPHFEKIMPFQAENLRVFADAARVWHEPEWLRVAGRIRGYMKDFLTSPEGAFYTSQDADLKPGQHGAEYFALDDTERRKRGVPRVDTHEYARENGLAITGLAAYYAASGDAGALADARRAAEWVMANRALAGGGYRHDAWDAAGPYLADTLEMCRGLLALYEVTGDRRWLAAAEGAGDFIAAHFRVEAGFATAATPAHSVLKAGPEIDENVELVRLTNMLWRYTGKKTYREMADHAMRYVASPAVVTRVGFSTAGILLAAGELAREPAHVCVVGGKDDALALQLFMTALREAPLYARIEWYDRREGPPPNADVEYPTLPAAAAYLCANGACSSPAQTPVALTAKLARINGRSGSSGSTPAQ